MTREKMRTCLIEKFGLFAVKSKVKLFSNRMLVVTFFDLEESEQSDFEEICIGVPNQIFHKNSYKKEIAVFTTFINTCFECCEELLFAVCTYESTSNAKKINDFTDEFLHTFPLSYKRILNQPHPVMRLNLEAMKQTCNFQ